MTYIKEPDGITFTVDSRDITEKDVQEISLFIQKIKEENKRKKRSKNPKIPKS